MNLNGLQADLYRRLKFATAPDSTVTTRLTAYLNETQREILGKKGYSQLRRHVLTFACIANTPFVSLPESIERVVTIQDRTSMIVLDEVDIQQIRFDDPALSATTTFPYEYAVLDYASAVAQQPSVADKLYVKSDSASDDNTKTAYVEGVVTGGYYQKVSVALNGVTAVQLGSLATWITVTKFYLALGAGGTTTAAGNVTLQQTSGAGTELARIPPGADYARYLRLHLHPTPSQINTYYADVELHVEDMSIAGDEPYLPEDFHWLLVSGALCKEYAYREKTTLYQLEFARYQNGLGDLVLYMRRRSGVGTGGERRRRFSQLGPNFPSGT